MAVTQNLTLTQLSQDTQSNTSQVRILWTSTQTDQSFNLTQRTAYCYICVNGGQEQTVEISYTLPQQSQTTLLDRVLTVAHNDSGNCTLEVRTWMDTNISAGVVELSKALRLTQIPKNSTLSAGGGVIGGTAALAVNRCNSSYTHSIAYSFGTLSGFITKNGGISATEVKFSAERVDFLLPESFYGAIPDSKKGVCTLTLRTYSGNTLIGQPVTAAFTVGTDKAVCKPTVSGTVVDSKATTVALTGDETKLIRYHSNALCTVTASAKKLATVAEKKICGQTVTGSTLKITGVEQDKFRFYACDSRGYAAAANVQCALIPYVRLTCRASVKRTSPTGSTAKLTLSGTFFNDSFGAVSNALTLRYQVGSGGYVTLTPVLSGNTYSASVTLEGMDYQQSYGITVQAADKLETVSKNLTLGTGQPVFDWGKDSFAFHVPVQMDKALALDQGGTGRKNWNGLDTDFAVIVKSPNGAFLSAIGTKNGAFYATQENGAAKFGTLPIAQGGTGAATAAEARKNLGAAAVDLTDGFLEYDSFQALESGLSQLYAGIADHGCRFYTLSVNGHLYGAYIWRGNQKYGTLRLFSYDGDGCRHKTLYNGTWQSWEWPDPPMVLGTQYRTTRRFQNLPVYTTLLNFGALPNSTTRTVAHGLSPTRIIEAKGQASNGMAFPVSGPAFYGIGLRVGLSNVEISTDYNYSDLTATVQIWYTKE